MNRSPLRDILRSEELRDKGKRDKGIGNDREEVVYHLTEIISSTESIASRRA